MASPSGSSSPVGGRRTAERIRSVWSEREPPPCRRPRPGWHRSGPAPTSCRALSRRCRAARPGSEPPSSPPPARQCWIIGLRQSRGRPKSSTRPGARRPAVVQDDVGDGTALLVGGLRGYLAARHPPAPHQRLDIRNCSTTSMRSKVAPAGLDEERMSWTIDGRPGAWPRSARRPQRAPGARSRRAWRGRRAAEDATAASAAGSRELFGPALPRRTPRRPPPGRTAGRDDLAGQHVGVHHPRTSLGQHGWYRALAVPDRWSTRCASTHCSSLIRRKVTDGRTCSSEPRVAPAHTSHTLIRFVSCDLPRRRGEPDDVRFDRRTGSSTCCCSALSSWSAPRPHPRSEPPEPSVSDGVQALRPAGQLIPARLFAVPPAGGTWSFSRQRWPPANRVRDHPQPQAGPEGHRPRTPRFWGLAFSAVEPGVYYRRELGPQRSERLVAGQRAASGDREPLRLHGGSAVAPAVAVAAARRRPPWPLRSVLPVRLEAGPGLRPPLHVLLVSRSP